MITVYTVATFGEAFSTDLRNVTEERIKTVERYLNNRPILKFDYLSPIQQTLKHRAVALVT